MPCSIPSSITCRSLLPSPQAPWWPPWTIRSAKRPAVTSLAPPIARDPAVAALSCEPDPRPALRASLRAGAGQAVSGTGTRLPVRFEPAPPAVKPKGSKTNKRTRQNQRNQKQNQKNQKRQPKPAKKIAVPKGNQRAHSAHPRGAGIPAPEKAARDNPGRSTRIGISASLLRCPPGTRLRQLLASGDGCYTNGPVLRQLARTHHFHRTHPQRCQIVLRVAIRQWRPLRRSAPPLWSRPHPRPNKCCTMMPLPW